MNSSVVFDLHTIVIGLNYRINNQICRIRMHKTQSFEVNFELINILVDLSVSDHIALPSKGGAMENWGLITYGEPVLCVDPETSAASGKLTVASIIAHELAHQVGWKSA